MKISKSIVVMTLVGALVGGSVAIAVEQPAELVFATFSAPAPASGVVTATISVVEEGIKVKIMDVDPLVIPFEAVPLLQKSLEEVKK